MSLKIFVALSTFSKESPEPLTALTASGLSFDVNPSGKRLTRQEVLDLKGYDGVVAGLEPYDREVLTSLPQLKCISRCGVGVDNVDLKAAGEFNVTVLNTPNVVIQPVAEMTIAMIFDLSRRLTEHTELMRKKSWQKLTGYQLAGKTVGVIGLGRIGRRVAEMLGALGVKVIAYDPAFDVAWADRYGVKLASIDELLKSSDLVTLHLAKSSAEFVMGKREFALMKEGSFFINVARGIFVDEAALADALTSRHLAGAALDVFKEEPYSGELCALPNVILTPHVATLTVESRAQMELEAVNNLIAYFKK